MSHHLLFCNVKLLFDARLLPLERFSLDVARQLAAAFLSAEKGGV